MSKKFNSIIEKVLLETDSTTPADMANAMKALAQKDPKAMTEFTGALQGQADPNKAVQDKKDQQSDPAHDLISALANNPKTTVTDHVEDLNDQKIKDALAKKGLAILSTNKSPETTQTTQTVNQQTPLAQQKTPEGKYPGQNA